MVSVVIEVLILVFRIFLSYIEALYRCFVPRSKKSVKGKIVLVTGGGHGIGREIAYLFGELGSRVVTWDINSEGNNETADTIRKYGGEAHAYICDVGKSDAVTAAAERVRDDVGDVDILVNNAGILHGGKLMTLSNQHIMKSIEVNILAHFWTVRNFLPNMLKKNEGHIVTLASMAAKIPTPSLVDYSCTKMAVDGFTEALRYELHFQKLNGIKTTTVYPLFVDTGMTKFPVMRFGRLLTPQETAIAIVNGVRRNHEEVYIPNNLSVTCKIYGFKAGRIHIIAGGKPGGPEKPALYDQLRTTVTLIT